MKKAGLIGGIGPESTIQYYRKIIKDFQSKLNTKDYPEIFIHTVNMTEMLGYIADKKFDLLVDFLASKIDNLQKAGADFAAMASNTPHIVFNRLQKKVNIPLLSIVEATCKAVQKSNVKTVALLGTKSTMSAGFYELEAKKFDLEVVVPKFIDRDYIHDKYMNELVYNHIDQETKLGLLSIIEQIQNKKKIEGIILGGTELPLILNQDDFDDLKVFDTTQIHVNDLVDNILSNMVE